VRKVTLAFALSILTFACVAWAVPKGIAHRHITEVGSEAPSQATAGSIRPIRLRDERDRGLLVDAWINGVGPFVFAVDTGSGINIITRRVVDSARLRVVSSRRPLVGGLSTSPISSNQEAQIQDLALGDRLNRVTSRTGAAIVTQLPGSLDGILDPTSTLSPLGYTIDLPNRVLLTFDSRVNPLRQSNDRNEGAVVRWVREAGSDKPFVKLGDGRLALIDTGSGFGLALNGGQQTEQRSRNVRDLGGGVVQSRTIAPLTVNIGALVLRGVPTDLLFGVPADTPAILGRRALYPFRLTFDPVARLISFETVERADVR
jgi:hypothetical protein